MREGVLLLFWRRRISSRETPDFFFDYALRRIKQLSSFSPVSGKGRRDVAIQGAQSGAMVEEVDPSTSFEALGADPDILLIDVRTRAEWAYVGAPDLSGLGKRLILIEWRRFPTMEVNAGFVDEVEQAVAASGVEPKELHFICRSGARSMEAARAVARAWGERGRPVSCVNVAEGFEGDLDADGRRGGLNGWKARGLPWRQN